MRSEVKQPLIDFIYFFKHLHSLNNVLLRSLMNYENLLEATNKVNDIIKKYSPEDANNNLESSDFIKFKKDSIATVQKEIDENYYTLKSSEIILLYSRLESAISETIYVIFQKTKITNIKELENMKINAVTYLQMNVRDRNIFLADQYIYHVTQSIKYGYTRFEAILKPFVGESKLSKEHKDCLFRFAQVRNLLVHKNGIVDRQFKQIFTDKKYKLNSRIDIDPIILNEFQSSIIAYLDDILSRIQERINTK